MSSHNNPKTDTFGRKTWNEEEYAEKAREKHRLYKEQRQDRQQPGTPGTVHDFFQSRTEQINKIDKLNKVAFVSSFNSKEAGFYCDLCNRKFQDNLKFIDHLNSREHLVNSGFDDESEISNTKNITLDQVKARLEMLVTKKLQHSGDADGDGDKWVNMRERIELRKKFEASEREKKKLKRQRKKQKTSNNDDGTNDGQTNNELNDEMKKIMGFSEFESSR